MNFRQLGRTELQISEISLGGAYLMGLDPLKAEGNTRQLVETALAFGINYIDTAPFYGQSESLLGHALSDTSCRFHLVTKVGLDQKTLIIVLIVSYGV